MAVYGSNYGSKDKSGNANTSNSQWGWEDWASWLSDAYDRYNREHDNGRWEQIPQTPEQQAFWRQILGMVENSPNNAGRLTGMADQIVTGYGNMETKMPGTIGVPGVPGSGGQVLYQKPNTPIDWSKIPGLDTGSPMTDAGGPNRFGAAGGVAGNKPGGRPQKVVADDTYNDWYIRNGGTGYGYDMISGNQPAGGIPRDDFGLPSIPGYGGEGPPEGMSYGQISPETRAAARNIYTYIREHGLQALNVAVASGVFGPMSPMLTGAIQFATWLYRKFGGNAPPEALQGGAPTGSAPVSPPTSGNGPLPPPA